jgi:predicted Zn finger-like uncharacterized protein
MDLATRCTACGTVFRVGQDQLKVSEGWVRCGRCGEVFNAITGLFDLERDGYPAKSLPAAAETGFSDFGAPLSDRVPLDAAFPSGRQRAGVGAPVVNRAPGLRLVPAGALPTQDRAGASKPQPSTFSSRFDEQAGGSSTDDGDAEVQASLPVGDEHLDAPVSSMQHDEVSSLMSVTPSLSPLSTGAPSSTSGFADARFNTRLFADDEASAAAPSRLQGADAAAPPGVLESSLEGPSPDDAPATAAFLVQAERAARWRRPWVRAALGASAVALAASLAAQVGVHFRDQLAATEPALRGPLETLCATVGCRVGAPMRIDALSVDSSAIAQVTNGTGYRLSVTLRNRAPHPVATPALDLTLTDANGQPIARRVIAASDFGAQATVLTASTETALQVWLSAGGAPVAGYTIELFYP